MLVDGVGTLLALVVTGAHCHAVFWMEVMLDSLVIGRFGIFEYPGICVLTRGIMGELVLKIVASRDFIPYIKDRNESKKGKESRLER